MVLDVDKLKQLKDSNDFEYIRKQLIMLKNCSKDEKNSEQYKRYITLLAHYRLFMKDEYICDTSFKSNNFDNKLLNDIVSKVIDKVLYYFEGRYKSINEVNMINNCYVVSLWCKEICDYLGIECELIRLYPGYSRESKLFDNCGYHCFNIINLNNKKYLVDISYKQFFKKNTNFLEEIGVPYLCAPLPGIFMMLDDKRKNLASKLLKTGFTELTLNNLKLYLDGFTLSYRNGLYYDYFGKSYSTSYTPLDYINFLTTDDNLLNHEPKECLGPLKIYK